MDNKLRYLCKRLQENFHNAEIERIGGMGWDQESHVHADLRVDDRKVSLFLKRLRLETQEAELYAYTKLLPDLDIHTPQFYGTFSDCESSRSWLVLERVEGQPIDLSDTRLARGLFDILGRLHGGARLLCSEENIPEHLRFNLVDMEKAFAKWHSLLVRNMSSISLDAQALDRLNGRLNNLRRVSCTWIHGDLDTSNLLCVGQQICVIDWEAGGLWPSSFDLGPVVARLPGVLLPEYVDIYCQSYIRCSGESLSRNQVWEWIDDGLVIDAMEWIAHYFEHKDEPGWTNWNGFYRTHVVPRVERLNALSERRDHTT